MLAAALAHRVKKHFDGRMHWFRVGAWDFRTVTEMMALRFGTSRERTETVAGLLAALARPSLTVRASHRHPRSRIPRLGRPSLVVFDNHEDDAVMARLLDALAPSGATFVITARRCLLSGVLIFPVTSPQVTSGVSAFPRVAELTRRLRWSPLALDIADAIVTSGAAETRELAAFLDQNGIANVHVIDHEDDLPEVALLIAWAWARLSAGSQRVLGVLANAFGDDVDLASLLTLAATRDAANVTALQRWHLVQEAAPGRFTLHAVVRHAVKKRVPPSPERGFEHYISMLERDPTRVATEQTHLFAAMDHAHRTSNLDAMLRVEKLLMRLA